MSTSIFSADLKYERPENKGITFGLSINNSELNLVPIIDENPHCRSFSNGHNIYKNPLYEEDIGKSAWRVLKNARTYILFLHEVYLNALLDSFVGYYLPVEECLFASSKNRIYSLGNLYSKMLNCSQSTGNYETCNDLSRSRFRKAIVHDMNTKLAGCVAKSLKTSPRFAKSFLSFIESDRGLSRQKQIYGLDSQFWNTSGIGSKFSRELKASDTDLKLLILSMTETNVCLNHSWFVSHAFYSTFVV